jgi:hypothetical protein
MRYAKITICLFVVLVTGSALATVYNVPGDYSSIQNAINACIDGDAVVIMPGTYYEHDISLGGRQITVSGSNPDDAGVVGNTIIDCDGGGRGFVFSLGETADSVVTGLTITNGNAFTVGGVGGGIYCYNNSSPTISKCVITGNEAGLFGGGIAVGNSGSSPWIVGCVITNNTANIGGGGVYCTAGSPIIENCIIAGNYAPRGGGIYSHNPGEPVIGNCTISGNRGSVFAGGLYCYNGSNLSISNSIFWANAAGYGASEILVDDIGESTSLEISYCDIDGIDENVVVDSGCIIYWGSGIMEADPEFVEPGGVDQYKNYVEGNYHLLDYSPCIDAGEIGIVALAAAQEGETDIDGDARVLGESVDIGADEYVAAIEAKIKIGPGALNQSGKGKWVKCTIRLGEGYDASDIDVSSIKLNNDVEVDVASSKVHKEKSNKVNKKKDCLHVKFDRALVLALVAEISGDDDGVVKLYVTGKLVNGTDFAGLDSIKVKDKHKKKSGRHGHKQKGKKK